MLLVSKNKHVWKLRSCEEQKIKDAALFIFKYITCDRCQYSASQVTLWSSKIGDKFVLLEMVKLYLTKKDDFGC